jgi:hypothetical protein
MESALFSGINIEDTTYFYTRGPPPSNTRSSGSRPGDPLTFENVVEIIEAYEYSRRAFEMDPNCSVKEKAFEDATETVDTVWQQYNGMRLQGHTRKLVELFLKLWLWDADLTGTAG